MASTRSSRAAVLVTQLARTNASTSFAASLASARPISPSATAARIAAIAAALSTAERSAGRANVTGRSRRGDRIRSRHSKKFIAAADKKLEDYLNRLDAGDTQEHASAGSRVKNLAEKIEALKKKRGEYAAYLSALEKSGESQISLTDPDSRAMAAYTKVGVGYNAQIAVDAKHKMIVEQAVTNDVLDMGLLQQTAEPARQILSPSPGRPWKSCANCTPSLCFSGSAEQRAADER
jgi:hypothetical protein